MRKLLVLVLVLGAIGMAAVSLREPGVRAASGPCGTSHDAMDAEESQFLSLLQQWRDQNVANSSPLQPSGPLNAAAAWFAEYLANKSGGGGHYDNYGRNWVQRAIDCGYHSYYANGSGEGVYAVASSRVLNIGPAEAIAGITYPGSGATMWVPASGNYPPVKCVGVAVKRNATGTAVAWVAVLAQYPASQPCPAASSGGGGGGTVTVTPGTATPSPTPTRTPSPTPSPTPVTYHAFAPLISADEPR
ncbi:MAG: hypothetical protein HS107_00020 [Thermoflexaceae bacterium]|nr:hypothetical protein [Thermoflexaceae bacterium]